MQSDPTDGVAQAAGQPEAQPASALQVEVGGDPACWAALICPTCGRMPDHGRPAICPNCGEPYPTDD